MSRCDFDTDCMYPECPATCYAAKSYLPTVDVTEKDRVRSGRVCADCSAEFVAATGYRACCATCRRLGSPLPQSRYEEVNREAHRNEARKRKARRQSNG